MSNILVTVCVPCYDQQEWLGDALDSVVAQTYKDWECLVVDDGSPEPITLTVSDPRIRLTRVTNRGLPNARNVALMQARGQGFLPLDADDWIAPDYLERTVPLLHDAEVVLTGIQEHGTSRNGTYRPGYDRPFDLVDLQIMWEYNRFFYCSLFRTDCLRSVGGYNGRMIHGFEDWDLWIDLLTRKTRFAAIQEPLFHYRTRDNSMVHEATRRRDEILAEIRRHHR